MNAGLWTAVVALLATVAIGGYRLVTDGRFRGCHRIDGATVGSVETAVPTPQHAWSLVTTSVPEAVLGEKATMLQFSSAFCAPCRATRRILADIVQIVPGVEHVEIDAEHHLELVRRLGVLRTPTTLILDGTGREVARATGAPRKEQVLAALGRA